MSDVGLTVKVDGKLKADLERAASAEGIGLDEFVTRALASEMERRRVHDFFADRARQGSVERAREILGRAGTKPPRPGDGLPEGWTPGR